MKIPLYKKKYKRGYINSTNSRFTALLLTISANNGAIVQNITHLKWVMKMKKSVVVVNITTGSCLTVYCCTVNCFIALM